MTLVYQYGLFKGENGAKSEAVPGFELEYKLSANSVKLTHQEVWRIIDGLTDFFMLNNPLIPHAYENSFKQIVTELLENMTKYADKTDTKTSLKFLNYNHCFVLETSNMVDEVHRERYVDYLNGIDGKAQIKRPVPTIPGR